MSKQPTTPKHADAPRCRRCACKLKPYIYFGDSVIDPKREKRFGYEGNGFFCTLRCGFRFALDAVKKGKL
jgi:hypothetical protein